MPGRRRSQRQHHQASKASIKEVNAKFRKFGAKYNNTGITKRPVVLNLASIGDRDFVGLQAQVNGVPWFWDLENDRINFGFSILQSQVEKPSTECGLCTEYFF